MKVRVLIILSASLVDRKYIFGLDGLRGIAVTWVLLFHMALFFSWNLDAEVTKLLHVFSGTGWLGVQLFFVLSGFLITGILIDEKGSKYQIRNFYGRRSLRIFPLYYATLLVAFIIMPVVVTVSANMEGGVEHQVWFWSYLMNWIRPFETLGGMSHFWSLCVEEQFYLLWPFVVIFLSRRMMVLVGLVMVLSAPIIRYILIYHFPGEIPGSDIGNDAAYFFTVARWDALGLGALLAVMVRSPRGKLYLDKFSGPVFAICLAYFLWHIAKFHNFTSTGLGWGVINQSVGAVLFSAFLYLVISPKHAGKFFFLELKAFKSVGKYSYAMYVFQIPVIMFWKAYNMGQYLNVFSGLDPFVMIVSNIMAVFVVTYVMSWVSWRVLEEPFLRMKRFFTTHKTDNEPVPLFELEPIRVK